MGVSARSIVYDVDTLRMRVGEMIAHFEQPVLCERFIEGREITVGVIGNLRGASPRRLNDRTAPTQLPSELTFFPPLEVHTREYGSSEAGLYTNRIKVELAHELHSTCPADLDSELQDTLPRLAAAVFRVMGCCDVARVDFRLDAQDGHRPYILEINPLPGLAPDYSDLPIEAYAAGWSYDRLITTIVDLAVARNGQPIRKR